MKNIYEYEVRFCRSKVITGHFRGSAGSFEIIYKDGSGNSDEIEVTLKDGQYQSVDGRPTKFKIVGQLEIQEVIEMFKLLEKVIINP